MDVLKFFRKISWKKLPKKLQAESTEIVEPVDVPDTPVPPETPRPSQPQEMLAITCIGYSHIKAGTVCQDSSLCRQAQNYRLIAVSDGHGSASFPRSDRGSRLACSIVNDVCEEFFTGALPEDREQAARALCQEILCRWTKAVYEDHCAEPFDDATLETVPEKYREHYRCGTRIEHAYGATLIAVMETPAGVLAIRCGDGECVMIDPKGTLSRPIPWNEKCDVNVTTSLCDNHAIEEFRWVWLDEKPAAIWISTDGLDNSYPIAAELDEFYAKLSLAALEENCDYVRQELENFLPVLTQRCSQDDISVAALMNVPELNFAQSKLQAYVDLQRSLREKDSILRQIKKLEKPHKTQTEEESQENSENILQLKSQLEELEGKIFRLRLIVEVSV